MYKFILSSAWIFIVGISAAKNNDFLNYNINAPTYISQSKNIINVYLITWLCNGELSETQFSGEFDEVANKLRVEKEVFDVKQNPLYGTKGDLRGLYQYVAGSYYFNKKSN